MQDTPELLRRLLAARFEMVLIGGVAAIAHGSARFTQDLDVLASFDQVNMNRLHTALSGTQPLHKPALTQSLRPPNELAAFRNVYLQTTLGAIDVLSDLGISDYASIRRRAIVRDVFGFPCPVISMDDLIAAKRFANRAKDREVVLELEALRALSD